jgi:hypothetical protein
VAMQMRTTTCLLFAIFCSGTLVVCQTISFQRPLSVGNGVGFNIHPEPNSIVAGDFNGDGKPDLVTLNSDNNLYSGSVTVSLGKGDGTFGPALILAGLSTYVSSPVVADFNGDGYLDVAFLETFNLQTRPAASPARSQLNISLGKGDGTFRPAIATPLSSNFGAPLLVADLNHDGRPDLVSGRGVLLGNGDGTFTALTTLIDGTPALTADFNRDGYPDLMIIQPSYSAAIVLGDGKGGFGPDIPISPRFTPRTFVAGDFNGDGMVDLAISPTLPLSCAEVPAPCQLPANSIAILLGVGDGTFRPPLMTPSAMGPLFAAADINGDGKLDLVVANSVMAGVGDGTFRYPVSFGLSSNACTPKYSSIECLLFGDYAALVADFNGDGKQDISEGFGSPYAGAETGVAILLNDSLATAFW